MFGALKSAKKRPFVVKPVVVVTPAPSKVITPESIAERAYHIWVKKGRPQDAATENWNQAERELKAAQR